MTTKTSYDISKFLMDRAYNQLIDDLTKLNALLDAMIDTAQLNRETLSTVLMEEAVDAGAITDDTTPIENIACDHICTSNCRRVGCNCEHGEWHE